jgi:hypothetical protein
VPYAWNLILDVDPPLLSNLTLMGDLYFDDTREESILKVKTIWVRSGKIIAGSKEIPFPNKLTIELHGNFDDPYLLIDPYIVASNKVLAITNVICFLLIFFITSHWNYTE